MPIMPTISMSNRRVTAIAARACEPRLANQASKQPVPEIVEGKVFTIPANGELNVVCTTTLTEPVLPRHVWFVALVTPEVLTLIP